MNWQGEINKELNLERNRIQKDKFYHSKKLIKKNLKFNKQKNKQKMHYNYKDKFINKEKFKFNINFLNSKNCVNKNNKNYKNKQRKKHNKQQLSLKNLN